VTNLQSETLPPIGHGYTIPAGSCDELLDDAGRPLPHARPLMAALARLGPDALAAAGQRRDATFMQQGITFEVAGSDGERRDRAWPLDLVRRVLTAAEWTTIKRGLARRIRALNAFVDDVYHAHEIVRAGIVPWSLIVSRPSFARAVHAVRPTSRSATAATTPTCRRSRRLPGRCQRQAERLRHHDAPVGNRPGVARAFLTGA
jgi:uncharacterized circularly permuted ATP-grasp superfamily protein